MTKVFVTGATGYLGVPLVAELLERGHDVTSLVRAGRSAPGNYVTGDALDSSTFTSYVAPCDTLVHLVGTPKPAPWKGKQFQKVDQKALEASLAAAVQAKVQHFIFLSVAQPAPVMRDYIAVRQECERQIRAAGLNATFVRPWYVLGPNHWWPVILIPFYKLAAHVPAWRETAARLGLVRRQEMINALVWAVENPAMGIHIFDVGRIRNPSQTQMKPKSRVVPRETGTIE